MSQLSLAFVWNCIFACCISCQCGASERVRSKCAFRISYCGRFSSIFFFSFLFATFYVQDGLNKKKRKRRRIQSLNYVTDKLRVKLFIFETEPDDYVEPKGNDTATDACDWQQTVSISFVSWMAKGKKLHFGIDQWNTAESALFVASKVLRYWMLNATATCCNSISTSHGSV